MNSGTYFSNLMAYGFNYHVAYADEQPDVTRPLEASDEPVAVEDANVVAKEKRRTKNFNVDEDKLLVSAWLNVSQDPIQGTDQSKAPIGAEFFNTSMQTRRLIPIALKYLS
jgi:hypothetical protein